MVCSVVCFLPRAATCVLQMYKCNRFQRRLFTAAECCGAIMDHFLLGYTFAAPLRPVTCVHMYFRPQESFSYGGGCDDGARRGCLVQGC